MVGKQQVSNQQTVGRKREEKPALERSEGIATPYPLPSTPCSKPELKELDRLKLERLNLSISNLNLQLALLNERSRALQIETAGFRVEREGLVRGITEGYGLDGKWKLNPDTMILEACDVGAGLAPAQ